MYSINFKSWLIPNLILIHFPSLAFAHKGHEHSVSEKPVVREEKKDDTILSIRERYLKDIEPIFRRSCGDCHSDKTNFPWYAGLPFIKGLIQSDIREARKHIDISGGFPFQSHGSPKEDLKAIQDSIEAEEMPPLSYRLMHRDAHLSKEDEEKVKIWVKDSLEKL